MVRRPKGRTLGEVEIGARIKTDQIVPVENAQLIEILFPLFADDTKGRKFHGHTSRGRKKRGKGSASAPAFVTSIYSRDFRPRTREFSSLLSHDFSLRKKSNNYAFPFAKFTYMRLFQRNDIVINGLSAAVVIHVAVGIFLRDFLAKRRRLVLLHVLAVI